MKVKNKNRQKDEFRKNKTNGHPAYVYEKDGDFFKFIGITHKKKRKVSIGNKTFRPKPMCDNPRKGDNGKSYYIPCSQKDKVNKFSKPLDDFKKLGDGDRYKFSKYIDPKHKGNKKRRK
ncbi:MAG: hypothetical protein LBQ05_01295 [Christensenellaceae bacterium]|jgi:hypothetical protein|nr:hypothetical protein [Christensenellaceae bacterium]